jgi:hypothetical protein
LLRRVGFLSQDSVPAKMTTKVEQEEVTENKNRHCCEAADKMA